MLDTRKIDSEIDDLTDAQDHFDETMTTLTDHVHSSSSTQAEIDEAFEEVRQSLLHTDASRLSELECFKEELEGYADWKHAHLIPEDQRIDYAKGIFTPSDGFLANHVDWDAVVEDLFAHDYTYAELDGDTYYVRME